MKSKIYIVSETMEESQIVSGIFLQLIKEKNIDAEIVSVSSAQSNTAAVYASPGDVVVAGTFQTITMADPNQRPIHLVDGTSITFKNTTN